MYHFHKLRSIRLKFISRYITVWDRTTQFTDGRVIQWDVVGHDTSYPTFVVVFTFDTKTVSYIVIISIQIAYIFDRKQLVS